MLAMGIFTDVILAIDRISTNGAELTEYECLVAMLANMKSAELKTVVESCDIIKLFSSMNLQETRTMEIALRLANILFSVVPFSDLMKNHQMEILQALQSNREDLVAFVLKKLKDGLRDVHSITTIPDAVLKHIVDLIASNSLHVSKAATNFIIATATSVPASTTQLFGPSYTAIFQDVCSKPQYALRVVEMAVEIFTLHPSAFIEIESSGILEPLLYGLFERDVLANLNFIEVAKRMVPVPLGYNWLVQHDVPHKLFHRLTEFKSDPMGNLIIPGYLAFFGCVARYYPQEWIGKGTMDKVCDIPMILADASANSDPTTSLAAMEAIGFIAGTLDGKIALQVHLDAQGVLMPALIKLGRLLKDSPTAICVRVLDSVSELLQHPAMDNACHTGQAKITLDWAAIVGQMGDPYSSVDFPLRSAGSLLKRIRSLALNPYTDVRLAALRCLVAFASQPWGVHLLLDQPGCMEYLLNRKTETGLLDATQLMETKYNIIQSILATVENYRSCDIPQFPPILSPEQTTCLKLYVKEGIWGIRSSETTVAMEPG